tara:strand:+ start:184 stop:597 length:414 start_codon:yes stop_codon:yes gene_type:complete
MKIEINTKLLCDNIEAELDIDAIADALDSTLDCKIDGFVSELDLSDEVRDAVNDLSFDYEIDSALNEYDFSRCDEVVDLQERVGNLEGIITRISQALPNSALFAMEETNRQLQERYNELEAKFKKMAGLDGIEEDQI